MKEIYWDERRKTAIIEETERFLAFVKKKNRMSYDKLNSEFIKIQKQIDKA